MPHTGSLALHGMTPKEVKVPFSLIFLDENPDISDHHLLSKKSRNRTAKYSCVINLVRNSREDQICDHFFKGRHLYVSFVLLS